MADSDDPERNRPVRPQLDRRSGYVSRVSSLRSAPRVNTAVGPSREPVPTASLSELSKIFDEDESDKQKMVQDFASSQQAEVGVSDLITEPDILAPHSSPESEDEDSGQNKDDLFRQYTANLEKWGAEAAEKLRVYRDTPIEYSPSQHEVNPKMSLSIAGPPTFSFSTPYPLTFTLHHHSNPRQLPITIHESGTPLDPLTHAFRLSLNSADNTPGHPISQVSQTPIAAAESPAGGTKLLKLRVGQSETRRTELRAEEWEVKNGMKVWIRMPHGRVTRWRYEDAPEPSFRRMSRGGLTDEDSIVLPVSNALLVEVVK